MTSTIFDVKVDRHDPTDLGDCLSASSEGVMTASSASRLRDAVLASTAAHYIEGHHDSISSRLEIEELFEKIKLAEHAARESLVIERPDEDTEYFTQAFRAGLKTS